MTRRRKTWQHEFEIRSEDQVSELIHDLGWEINKPQRDYGEDKWVQVFKEGNPSREVFYIQLKGTDNPAQYRKKSGVFSYPIETVNLKQWSSYTIPVILVLWDVTSKTGYWLHIQPYLSNILKTKPRWLDNLNGKKQIHIPDGQIFSTLDTQSLYKTIEEEYIKISLGRQRIENSQEERIAEIGREIAPSKRSEATDETRALPPRVRQQQQLAQYEMSLNADPANATALIGKACIYYELGEMDKALVSINKAWALGNHDPKTAWVRGCIFTEYAISNDNKPQSMLHEAIDLFSSAALIASSALLNYNIGNSLSALGKYEEAIEKYDQALLSSPPKDLASQIWKNRGTAFFHSGRYDEEIASYKNALSQNPNLWEAFASWAVTEAQLGHLKESKALLLKAFDANPGLRESNFALSYRLAHTLWKMGEKYEAYQWVNQVLHVKPNHVNAQKLKALLLAELWRDNPVYKIAAIPFFKNALIDDPSNILAQTELYLILSSEGFKDEAKAILNDEIDLKSVPPELLYDCAMIFAKEGDKFRAIKFLDVASETSQKHHIVHKLANLKKEAGEYRRAIELYKLAIRDVKNPIPILRDVADCYYAVKEFDKCVAIMVRFILTEPLNEAWWTNLATVLLQLNRQATVRVFSALIRRLHNREIISDSEVQKTIEKLLSQLRREFGEDFVSRIVNSESDYF